MRMRSVWEEAKGKRGEGCAMGGMVWLRSLPLLFKGVDCVCDVDNVDNYRLVLSWRKRHLHRRTNQIEALARVAIAHGPMRARISSPSGVSNGPPKY